MTEQEAIKRLKDLKDPCSYSDCVALEIAIEALEKQIPKKVKEIHVDEYCCPSCWSENNCNDRIVEDKYCPNCGQRLWRNEDAE